MNRCRGKNIETNQWVYGYYVWDNAPYILEDLSMIVRGTPELVNAHQVLLGSIGRCVHYCDCTKTLMYEGDIVQAHNCDIMRYIVRYGSYANKVGLGYYMGIGFFLELVGNPEHKVPMDANTCLTLRVLGNINDNPELLIKGDLG